MDKNTIITTAINYKNDLVSLAYFKHVVEQCFAAQIAQSQCSTLREAIEQELMLLQKRIALWPEGSLEYERLYAQKDTYQKVLSFIKDMSPVA